MLERGLNVIEGNDHLMEPLALVSLMRLAGEPPGLQIVTNPGTGGPQQRIPQQRLGTLAQLDGPEPGQYRLRRRQRRLRLWRRLDRVTLPAPGPSHGDAPAAGGGCIAIF